jgi:hypothetical protein
MLRVEERCSQHSCLSIWASDNAGILRFLTVGSNGSVMNDDDKRDTSMLVQAVNLDEFLKD